jgi:hypothetical protein
MLRHMSAFSEKIRRPTANCSTTRRENFGWIRLDQVGLSAIGGGDPTDVSHLD